MEAHEAFDPPRAPRKADRQGWRRLGLPMFAAAAMCQVMVKAQRQSGATAPAATPAAQPSCSQGRHLFGDIGPLPRLIFVFPVSRGPLPGRAP